MIIKIFCPNDNGKIELTKEELEQLCKEMYDNGHTDGYNEGLANGLASGHQITCPTQPIPVWYDAGTPKEIPRQWEITCTDLTTESVSSDGTHTKANTFYIEKTNPKVEEIN